ncbi:MAG: DUF4342 domain-containing protein [Syntrophaceticus sp.]|nr:DUF4342 domain-containing protein [Syntrophaceticus sp.]
MDDVDDLLEKVDFIRQRMGVSYKEAKDALDEANGDAVNALIMLEQEQEGKSCCSWGDILSKGACTKIRLKKGDASLCEVPVGVGMVGILGMLVSDELAVLGAVGTVAALLNNCTLEIADEIMSDESEEEVGHNMSEGVEVQIQT